ncbi:MAG: type II toxin-antitoxin system RelE/ParE family toxin [Campylobacterales bacterium]|nr:type II toxin-antitoxin system RelE/ParE family toxin [Campylobacterales bacterium]
MRILKSDGFNKEIKEILQFIATDSPTNAKRFKDTLFVKINELAFMPYKFRQSIYFDDANIRDMIFKGYVISYKIQADTITLIGIIKYRNFGDQNEPNRRS